MQARQGSVVRRHRKTISHDSFQPRYDLFTHAQLDQEIKLRSQRGESFWKRCLRIRLNLVQRF
jgi:hypothetical protein